MKKIILKLRELKNRILYSRIYSNYVDFLLSDKTELTYDDLKDIDPDYIPCCSFSLKHHLTKIF